MTASLKDNFPVQTGWRGQHSGVNLRSQVIAKTQEEWEELWNETHSDRSPIPPAPKLPEGKMAIGIFAGFTNNPVDIKVTGITQAKGAAVIEFKAESKFSVMAVMNNPFLLKFVDKIDNDAILFNEVSVKKAKPQPPTGLQKNPNYGFFGGYDDF